MLFLSGKGLEFHIISPLTLLARRPDFLEEKPLFLELTQILSIIFSIWKRWWWDILSPLDAHNY